MRHVSLTALIADCLVIWVDWGNHQEGLDTTQAEEESHNLPAVAKIVDRKVDTAVDGEKEVTNEEQLRADRDFLESII